jgi:thymidylate synthase ThyX
MTDNKFETKPETSASTPNTTQVFAVHGADPEVLAYAMAKYSRSAISMRDSLREISSQRAEQFLNTFYFQYGHRSIADLAHVAFAIERLSLLAAIELLDEQRWDGQERSTRYQDFRKSGWYRPDLSADPAAEKLYSATIEKLFADYQSISARVLDALKERVPQPPAGHPDEMKEDAWLRTLKARAFDVARYLLPLATNTSLGQIVNARTLEQQIARLLGSQFKEVRDLGEKLREAASAPAWNVQGEAMAELQQKIKALDPALAEESAKLLTREVHVSPTLVKYTTPSEYLRDTNLELRQAAFELFGREPIAEAPLVDLVERTETLEVELAATLLYAASHHSYRQVRDIVADLPEQQVAEIIDLGLRHRGRHDELLRQFHAGAALRFDILMDIGGFRDMHRHRRCTQILQSYTTLHGYQVPEHGDLAGVSDAGVLNDYRAALDAAHAASRVIAASSAPEAAASANYLLPLATRHRALFKMDYAEALYISELRSAPAGHFSYREVAWEMFRALEHQHPTLAKYIRVTDYSRPVDILKR